MFKGTYEHIVHVESFKNIDLFQQGLYYLRFYFTNQLGDFATPYNYFEGTNKKKESQQWMPGQIQDDANAFQTKTFMIRFQEEEVEIDESCIFKIEVPASPHYECQFTLTCELMCADIQRIGGPPSDDTLFKSVATFTGTIRNSFKGIHEYAPIMFDSHHFCLVHCTVHSILQDFKFRLSDLQVSLNQDRSKQSRGKVLIQPKSFTEFLHKQTCKFTKSQEFFDYYVGQLRETCEELQKQVAKMCGQLKLYEELQKLPVIPKYSYIQYKESSILQNNNQQNGNYLLADVLNLSNIKDQNLLGSLIENDINQFASVLFELQNILINIIQTNSKQFRVLLQKEYTEKIKEKWGETFIREQIKCDSFGIGNLCQKQHEQIAQQLRKKPQILESLLEIEDFNLFPEIKNCPILFEEIYQKSAPLAKQDQQIQLIVLVHGFQGNSLDMRLIRNNLQLQYPNYHYLCSKNNEDQTDGNIADMGTNLALEVKQYITEYIKSNNFKLTFIGHSLGGVIMRAALPQLQEYKINMNTFISLSSPHLGYGYNNSLLIDAGLWFLKRMRKSISLQQLAMTDAPTIEDTFLYQLSKCQGINWFQNVVFVSSAQDMYVPFESARIQKSFEKNDLNSKKYEKMVDNLMNGLRAPEIRRLDVNFVLHENRTIDNMIGRTAHIMFLENSSFLRMLVTCLENVFN